MEDLVHPRDAIKALFDKALRAAPDSAEEKLWLKDLTTETTHLSQRISAVATRALAAPGADPKTVMASLRGVSFGHAVILLQLHDNVRDAALNKRDVLIKGCVNDLAAACENMIEHEKRVYTYQPTAYDSDPFRQTCNHLVSAVGRLLPQHCVAEKGILLASLNTIIKTWAGMDIQTDKKFHCHPAEHQLDSIIAFMDSGIPYLMRMAQGLKKELFPAPLSRQWIRNQFTRHFFPKRGLD